MSTRAGDWSVAHFTCPSALRACYADWLASWCFANGQTDLAFTAYERHLASDLHLGQPSAPNPFVNALYLAWALLQGQPLVFVFRFSSPNPFEGCPEVALGSGALYYFACSRCERFSRVAQWT